MSTQAFLELSAALLGLAALFGWINSRWLRLPLTIGLTVIALISALGVQAADLIFGLGYGAAARAAMAQIDFHDGLMLGMLHFLLFAGALHVDLTALLARKWHVLLMASMGVLLSTAVIGVGAWAVTSALGLGLPLIWCLVFGALISPTDPVAVLSILRTVTVPESLRVKIAGESLLNDGVGVVVFLGLLGVAASGGHVDMGHIAELVFSEVIVGVLIGAAAGGVAFYMMRRVDDYVVEIIISLALVTCVYALCLRLHASGPLAVVVAGLLIGNYGERYAMSESTLEHLHVFWELIDEILNAVLFLLLGFEVLVIAFDAPRIIAAALAIPLALLGRTVAVATPVGLIRGFGGTMTQGAVPALIWGGVRGGISVALALSLPDFDGKETILAMTYGVVVFSVIVQGLTVAAVIRRFVRAPEPAGETAPEGRGADA